MTAFVVETAFKASKDQVTVQLKAQSKEAMRFSSKITAAFKQATKHSKIFRANLGANLMSRAITSATSLMSRGVRNVIEDFVAFDQSIGQAAAKMPEKIKRGTEAFKALEDAARITGKNTKYTATEAADALNFLAMAGFNMEQSIAALPQVTDLATAANMDLARATDISSDALGAFNLMTKDAAQLTTNLQRVNDVFAATVTSANVDMEMLFESMKDGGPVMTSAGQSLETFSALVGKMGSSGIKGSKAGMTLKNMILQLQGPTAGAKRELKKLGIEVSDSEGNMRDIIEILGDYNEATKDMGSTQRDAKTDLIFGRRAIAGVNVLLSEGEEGLKAYRDQLEQSGGAAGEMAGEIEKSLGNKLLKLKSAAIELGFQLLESFSGEGKEGIDGLIETIRSFDMKPIIAGVRDVIGFMKWLFRLIRDNWSTVKILVGGIVAFKVALGVIGFAQAISGFTKLGAAVAGVGTAKAPGVAAAGGAPAAAKPTAGQAAGGVVAAATAGYAIGNLLEENVLDPIRQEGQKFENQINMLALKYQGIGRGSVKINELSMAELEIALKQLQITRRQIEEEGAPVHSVEDFFSTFSEMGNILGIRGAEFLGLLDPEQAKKMEKEHEGLMTQRITTEQQLAQAQAEILARLIALKQQALAAQAVGSTDINVNVNAPPGTTVESKTSGKGAAPKVNQSQAGKT